ncbi:hypothetical protein ACE38V_13735 [Cytobacillus sp. Hz8]|uniref:hypothetical protein n=1 Tax=Cytobacillus sp. Hz8 TaxID=3347168 RepID=UPI0035E1ED0F
MVDLLIAPPYLGQSWLHIIFATIGVGLPAIRNEAKWLYDRMMDDFFLLLVSIGFFFIIGIGLYAHLPFEKGVKRHIISKKITILDSTHV